MLKKKKMSIKVLNVTKVYGKQHALDDVSFEIDSGEIVGFLGPNGAGKSTMMKIITGFIPPTYGEVFVNNISIKTDPLQIKKRIGYLPEHNPLYLDMYVKEYLKFSGEVYGITNGLTQKIDEIISLTGLEIEKKKKIGALSKGYRQRVGLAQALLHNPEVLILDEPTSGLDPNQIVEIRNLISEAGKNKTVLLSTHIMQEVEAICDRVIIINKGKIIANKPISAIQELIKDTHQLVEIEFNQKVDKNTLEQLSGVQKASNIKENMWEIEASVQEDIRSALFRFAVDNKLEVLSLKKQEKSIESVFQQLTKEEDA